MKAPALIAFGAAALGLVVVAIWQVSGPPADPDDFVETDPRDEPDDRVLPGGVSLDMRGKSGKRTDHGVTPQFMAGAGVPGDQRIEAGSARETFGNALAELDQLILDRRRVKPAEFDEIYRWANDAYTGYSMTLDASNPDERAALDDAHLQLMKRLGKLRKRVRKKRRGKAPTPLPTPAP